MKKVLVLFIVALSFFVSGTTYAFGNPGDSLEIQFGIASKHASERPDGLPWNQRNTGIAFQYVSPGTLWGAKVETCITAGQIENSEFGHTKYLGGCVRKSILDVDSFKVSVGVFGGAMTYPSIYNLDRDPGKVYAVVLPTVSTCYKGICLDSTILPKYKDRSITAAVLFTARFPLYRW